MTDYLASIGEMLKLEKCVVGSLNATGYAVYVIVDTELTRFEFTELLRAHRLMPTSSINTSGSSA